MLLYRIMYRYSLLFVVCLASAVACRPVKFSLATTNVLAHGAYTGGMSPHKRHTSFNNGFSHPKMYKKTDFICVQEWDKTFHHNVKLPKNYRYAGFHPTSKGESGIFYRADRWQHLSTSYMPFNPQGNKMSVIASFQHKSTGKYIVVASCHVPYGQQNQLQVIQNVKQKAQTDALKLGPQNKSCPIIITGDFNYDTHGNRGKYQNLTSVMSGFHDVAYLDNVPRLTTLKGNKSTDYIWFNSGSFRLQWNGDFYRKPQNKHQLLSMTNKNPATRYFSDHATLKANFVM